ncbi:MAG: hypothetical protein LBQ14_05115 [Treponema sp.]|nr:hypothetical protein [Treponema sp.]
MYPESGVWQDFTGSVLYTVYAEDGSWQEYMVDVIVKTASSAEIIWFDLELPAPGGVYLAEGIVTQTSGGGTVEIHVPSGTDLSSPLTAKIVKTGDSLTGSNIISAFTYSASGTAARGNGDFSTLVSTPATYTVTSEDTSITKNYDVSIIVDKSADTGILDFAVFKESTYTNQLPNVVIGENLDPAGRITITIQVPYGTDEEDMYARIRLNDPASSIAHPNGTVSPYGGLTEIFTPSRAFTGKILFGSPNNANDQESIYTVTAENGATQTYVVVVSETPPYYYVDGDHGDDRRPDYYNGGSPGYPFKTLAYAVKKAAETNGIETILIMGDLTADNQSTDNPDGRVNTALLNSNNVITVDGSGGKRLTIKSDDSGVTRTLQGSSGKRVLGISGGADLTFENINVTGGNSAGNGGGIYVTGNSKVDFTGNITGNTAKSGGGVYLEAGTGVSDFSSFTLTSGEISDNTATGSDSGDPNVSAMDGGGGVYIKGNASFDLKAGGTISVNKAGATLGTGGAGGGVLVNGNVTGSTEYGLFMEGGKITGNISNSSTYPHGGGGVYVAQGAFEMLGGEVTHNTAKRQGGGVFVHWANSSALTARFTASGGSIITDNDGVGSSKDICNRGITELRDTATTDRVYIWDYGATPSQSFTVGNSVLIKTGIALARSMDKSTSNKNFITLVDDGMDDYTPQGTPINIDLESHLENGTFASNVNDDWLNQKVIEGNNTTLTTMVPRLTLNSFTGSPSIPYQLYNNYKIEVSGTEGKFASR